MVDCFLVLMLPGAGDELQGIKKGVLELADLIAVNKSDGEGAGLARVALGELKAALRYVPRKRGDWEPQAVALSARTGDGIDALWTIVGEHRAALEKSGGLSELRHEQQRSWMWSLISERLELSFRHHPQVAQKLPSLEAEVRAGRMTPTSAADALLAIFGV